jgi:hypothetical protein
MNRNFWTSSISALLIGFTIAAIFAYNLWSYCCGRCTARAFLTIGIHAGLLIGLTGGAALILFFLRSRRRSALARSHCLCGSRLSSVWSFCPACGRSSQPNS